MAVMLRAPSAERTTRPGQPLTAAQFRPVALNGLGDPANAYAHSMGWFKNALYIGVTRHTQYAQKKYDLNEYSSIWPVEVPEFIWDADWRARLWRFDPTTARWDVPHTSRLCMGTRGFEVPLQVGFRDMQVFQGRSDDAPALYVTSWGSHMGVGPFILRSTDGRTFEEVSAPNYPWFGSQTLRSLVSLKRWLLTAPTGRCGITEDHHDGCMVLASEDPGRGTWQPACRAFFDDRRNLTVFDMGVFDDHVYAGTMNPTEGCELWKSDLEGKPPFRWTRVLSHGAGRGPLNEGLISFAEFNGALYIGTGIYNCGYDRTFKVGPGAPELLRVWPDDSYDLIVGEPRMTPQGFKTPRSGLGPGFNNPFAGYTWRLCAHDGWLYATTAVWSPWLPFTQVDSWPESLRKMMGSTPLEDLLDEFGGFDLWRSRDGDHWTPVTRNGFGNPFNIGARTMVSTPYGLFAGTANSFGPRVAVPRVAGWRYEPNPKGGLEVWLGSQAPLGASAGIRPAAAGASSQEAPMTLHSDTGRDDLLRELYGASGYRHTGFWTKGTLDAGRACDALVDEVVAFTTTPALSKQPRYPTEEEFQAWLERRNGTGVSGHGNGNGNGASAFPGNGNGGHARRILEVGCGAGATTRALLRHFPDALLTAAARDRDDAALCAVNAPAVRVLPRPLPALKTPAEAFDLVFSIEGMLRLDRTRLFREIHRSLIAGGRFAGADLLLDDDDGNRALDAPGYALLLRRAGFTEVTVVDVAQRTAEPFRAHLFRFLEMKGMLGIDTGSLQEMRAALPGGGDAMRGYVLFGARKEGRS
jgi:SAM-dependent methyltransferase